MVKMIKNLKTRFLHFIAKKLDALSSFLKNFDKDEIFGMVQEDARTLGRILTSVGAAGMIIGEDKIPVSDGVLVFVIGLSCWLFGIMRRKGAEEPYKFQRKRK